MTNNTFSASSNIAHFIAACEQAGFKTEDAVAAWENGISGGVVGMIQLAHNMTGHAAGIGGTEEKVRACAVAANIVLREIREMMAA